MLSFPRLLQHGLTALLRILQLYPYSLGLRDAIDYDIFTTAKQENAIIMSKDDDFIQLIEKYGSPPKLLWITCGNTSNARLKEVLSLTLKKALTLLENGENIVEISDKKAY